MQVCTFSPWRYDKSLFRSSVRLWVHIQFHLNVTGDQVPIDTRDVAVPWGVLCSSLHIKSAWSRHSYDCFKCSSCRIPMFQYSEIHLLFRLSPTYEWVFIFPQILHCLKLLVFLSSNEGKVDPVSRHQSMVSRGSDGKTFWAFFSVTVNRPKEKSPQYSLN
jgi:hypothetical protein